MGDQDQSTLKKSHRYDLFTISTNNQKCVLRKNCQFQKGITRLNILGQPALPHDAGQIVSLSFAN